MYEIPKPQSNFDDVGDFHTKFGLTSVTSEGVGPRRVPSELMEFRINFLLEELGELVEALGGRIGVSDFVVGGARTITAVIPEDPEIDHATAFDSLLDLAYVVLGTAHLFGYPWQVGWDEVQAANMAKVRARTDGSDSKRGSSFDVVKPEGWEPPDIAMILLNFGWRMDGSD